MKAMAEIMQAAAASLIVYWTERSGKATSLNNFPFVSSQCGVFGDTPSNLLSAVLQNGVFLIIGSSLGCSWWLAMLIGYGSTLLVPFIYGIVRDGRVYFIAPSLNYSGNDKSLLVDSPRSTDPPFVANERPRDDETFKHSPLIDSRGFRCLLLKNAKSNDAIIECELHDFSVDTPAIYDALSYCWENQIPSETILCDNKRFLVTLTCMAALKHLRRRRVGRLLWVDAICIDQTEEGEEERNYQVQIMGHIYSRATQVVIWFGPGTPESRLVFQYLRFCIRLVPLPQFASEWMTEKLLQKILVRGHGNYIRQISRTPWYSRVWTVQEIAMAKRGCCTILCGDETLNYDHAGIGLFEIAESLHLRDDYSLNDMLHRPEPILRSEMRGRVLFKKSPSGNKMPPMMRFLLNYHSSDPKDKIFGFYGIFKESGLRMPVPNYAQSLGQVYWSGTVAILNQEPTLCLLPLAAGVNNNLPLVPTWVPDFRMPYSLMFLDGVFRPSGESLAEFKIPNRGPKFQIYENILSALKIPTVGLNIRALEKTLSKHENSTGGDELHVFGNIIDTVVDRSNWKVWEPPFGSTGMEDSRYFGLDDVHIFCPTIFAFQDFLNFALSTKTYLRYDRKELGKVIEETFTHRKLNLMAPSGHEWANWSLILTSTHSQWPSVEGYNLEVYHCNAEADPEMKRRFFDNPELQEVTTLETWLVMCAMKMDPSAARFLHLAWAVCRGNTFFSTKEGYLGNGSAKMVVGDKVALIQGLRLPMILRPVESQGVTRYQVVGPTFIHGVMDGELWNQDEVESLVLI